MTPLLDASLILGFFLQAAGVVLVVIAAFLHDRRQTSGLGPLVWGGVFTTCAGSSLVLVCIFVAAILASTHP